MAPDVDPYLTLGVPPGASLNEIKSAYRRLAKQYHPDTAGERALPRFLAIQRAYERLVDAEGRLRAHGGDAWRARPAPTGSRPRASRDAWRARRSAPGSGSSGGAGGAGGGARQPGAGSRSSAGAAGQGTGGAGADRARPGEPRGDGERTSTRHRRGPRKATPGSTTYDDAAEVGRDPEWDGGAWSGPSMGTFWTINPREYADPRKHGPEYLARARRPAAGATEPPEADDAPPEPATAGDAPDGAWAWTGAGPTETRGDTADWAARAWTYDTREPGGATWTPGAEPRREDPWRPPATTDVPGLPDLETLLRRASPATLLARARASGHAWRLVIALIGWPPIGYAISSLVSDGTGCSGYTAACPQEVPALLVIAQLLVIAALYAVPVVAAVAAFASLAALAVALPVAAILSVGSGPRAAGPAILLQIAVVVAYLAGFAGAAWRLWRRPRPPDAAA